MTKTYDFGVVYKSHVPDGEKREYKKEGDDNQGSYGQRKPRDRGTAFG